MRPVGGFIGRSGLSPNAITLIGVGVQAIVAAKIIAGSLVAAGLLAIVAGLADVLDGAVAKARGMTSRFGALFDSTMDRLSDALYFLPVAWLYGVSPDQPHEQQEWVAGLALVALVSAFLVSYVKARAEGLGVECNVGIAERAERTILMIAALVFDVIPPILVTLSALSIITFVQRLFHVRRQIPRATG